MARFPSKICGQCVKRAQTACIGQYRSYRHRTDTEEMDLPIPPCAIEWPSRTRIFTPSTPGQPRMWLGKMTR
ncbi:hypothetical protein PISMIDRAFT_516512 [Pisolithus microcarpus 441]|uniref:Uncharacterized protein n=1 Tax=Pisolithus microcarpus 441 TaxID=765257 RepID=A0A0D0A3W6_9AGAM|nr:hypothetical protein PISMIDRAFT_516512 [Pisolithus microcarpus 441]